MCHLYYISVKNGKTFGNDTIYCSSLAIQRFQCVHACRFAGKSETFSDLGCKSIIGRSPGLVIWKQLLFIRVHFCCNMLTELWIIPQITYLL